MTREVVESGRKEYKTTIPKSSVHSKETSKECLKKEVMVICHVRILS